MIFDVEVVYKVVGGVVFTTLHVKGVLVGI